MHIRIVVNFSLWGWLRTKDLTTVGPQKQIPGETYVGQMLYGLKYYVLILVGIVVLFRFGTLHYCFL